MKIKISEKLYREKGNSPLLKTPRKRLSFMAIMVGPNLVPTVQEWSIMDNYLQQHFDYFFANWCKCSYKYFHIKMVRVGSLVVCLNQTDHKKWSTDKNFFCNIEITKLALKLFSNLWLSFLCKFLIFLN